MKPKKPYVRLEPITTKSWGEVPAVVFTQSKLNTNLAALWFVTMTVGSVVMYLSAGEEDMPIVGRNVLGNQILALFCGLASLWMVTLVLPCVFRPKVKLALTVEGIVLARWFMRIEIPWDSLAWIRLKGNRVFFRLKEDSSSLGDGQRGYSQKDVYRLAPTLKLYPDGGKTVSAALFFYMWQFSEKRIQIGTEEGMDQLAGLGETGFRLSAMNSWDDLYGPTEGKFIIFVDGELREYQLTVPPPETFEEFCRRMNGHLKYEFGEVMSGDQLEEMLWNMEYHFSPLDWNEPDDSLYELFMSDEKLREYARTWVKLSPPENLSLLFWHGSKQPTLAYQESTCPDCPPELEWMVIEWGSQRPVEWAEIACKYRENRFLRYLILQGMNETSVPVFRDWLEELRGIENLDPDEMSDVERLLKMS